MTQKERILDRLKKAGRWGIPTAQLFDGLFCCNYRARISELRQMGYGILAIKLKGETAQWRYFLQQMPGESPRFCDQDAESFAAVAGSKWNPEVVYQQTMDAIERVSQ